MMPEFFEAEDVAFLIAIITRYKIKLEDSQMTAEELLQTSFSFALA